MYGVDINCYAGFPGFGFIYPERSEFCVRKQRVFWLFFWGEGGIKKINIEVESFRLNSIYDTCMSVKYYRLIGWVFVYLLHF
jgi:hypothetical protein